MLKIFKRPESLSLPSTNKQLGESPRKTQFPISYNGDFLGNKHDEGRILYHQPLVLSGASPQSRRTKLLHARQ